MRHAIIIFNFQLKSSLFDQC